MATMNELAKNVANEAINTILVDGKTISEWIELLKGFRWISVKDRLPEDGDSYLVVVKEKYDHEPEWRYHVDVASNYGDYIDGYWDTFNDWKEGQEVHVTHWMPIPLPELPKEE